jgi:HTH-type transcriptional regulator/antitoxin HigA
MSTSLANQAKIIAEGAPRVVQNDERLEEHTNAVFRLTAVDNTPPSELEAIELLTLLVERYDETYCPSAGRSDYSKS